MKKRILVFTLVLLASVFALAQDTRIAQHRPYPVSLITKLDRKFLYMNCKTVLNKICPNQSRRQLGKPNRDFGHGSVSMADAQCLLSKRSVGLKIDEAKGGGFQACAHGGYRDMKTCLKTVSLIKTHKPRPRHQGDQYMPGDYGTREAVANEAL